MLAASARRLAPAVTAVLIALIVAGCGGAADPGPEIARTLRTALTTSDPELLCRRTLSARLVASVYGGAARCLQVERAAASSRGAAGSVQVTRIRTKDDRGDAFVVVRGGDQDGARGGLTLVREQGAWRLDDLSTEFLRSGFAGGMESGQGLTAALSACVSRKVIELDDAALRRLAFGAMGARPQAQMQLRALVEACVQGLGAPASGDVA